MTSDALARRSVAMTCAPERGWPPITWAVWPSTSMSAPMRRSSGTCMKRFSKMVSTMHEVPCARHMSTMNWACMSVGKPGCGAVVTSTARRGRSSRRTRTAVALAADLDAGLAELGDDGLEVFEGGALDEHVAAGGGRGDHVRAGLDAVADDGVIEGVERVGAVDVDDVGAGAVDARAHLVEHAAELLDLGLARAVHEGGAALREGGGHHEVLGAGHRGDVEHDLGAAKATALGDDVAAAELDLGAHRLQALEVLVDRARSDLAAAWQRDLGAAVAGEQRAEHEDARAHLLDELVGGLGPGVAGGLADAHEGASTWTSRPRKRRSAAVVSMSRSLGTLRSRLSPSESKRRAEDRERCVLGAAHRDGAVEPLSPADADSVHGLPFAQSRPEGETPCNEPAPFSRGL
jgi:hypothetical protein